ncbi:MAG TPA: DUF1918 domain-containing protein [Gaiellaceae bacterium]
MSIIEITGRTVGNAPRRGEIVEILGDSARPHYRVQWEDGHVSTLFPGSDVRIIPPPVSERELRACHGYTVDSAEGHVGSVLHVRKAKGGLELHVATPQGVVRVPQASIRHFDPHTKRIAVVLG